MPLPKEAFRSVFSLARAGHLLTIGSSSGLFLWIIKLLPSQVFSCFGKPLRFLWLFHSRPCLELFLGAYRPTIILQNIEMLGLPVFGHHLHPGPPIFLTDSFPLSLALQLLGYTSISLFCKFTSIIMALKLFAMLASWVALQCNGALSRWCSGCLSHRLILAEGFCKSFHHSSVSPRKTRIVEGPLLWDQKKLVPYETSLDCSAFTSGFCRRTKFQTEQTI